MNGSSSSRIDGRSSDLIPRDSSPTPHESSGSGTWDALTSGNAALVNSRQEIMEKRSDVLGGQGTKKSRAERIARKPLAVEGDDDTQDENAPFPLDHVMASSSSLSAAAVGSGPFDAFLSAPVETNMGFVSQFLMLSSAERAKMLYSLEGMGELGEEHCTEEQQAARQRALQDAVEALEAREKEDKAARDGGGEAEGRRRRGHANATDTERNGAPLLTSVLSDEDDTVLDVDAAVPEVRTGYMTTLFTDAVHSTSPPAKSKSKSKKKKKHTDSGSRRSSCPSYQHSSRSRSSSGSSVPQPVLFDTFNLEQADEEREQLRWRQQQQQQQQQPPPPQQKQEPLSHYLSGAQAKLAIRHLSEGLRPNGATTTTAAALAEEMEPKVEFYVPALDEFLSLSPPRTPPPPGNMTGLQTTADHHQDPTAEPTGAATKGMEDQTASRCSTDEPRQLSIFGSSASSAVFSGDSSAASLPGLEPLETPENPSTTATDCNVIPKQSSVSSSVDGQVHAAAHDDATPNPGTHPSLMLSVSLSKANSPSPFAKIESGPSESVSPQPLLGDMLHTAGAYHVMEEAEEVTHSSGFPSTNRNSASLRLLQPAGTYKSITRAALDELNEMIREVSDDVVPFTADPYDEDEEERYLEGAALKQFNGDWKAYRLAPVDTREDSVS